MKNINKILQYAQVRKENSTSYVGKVGFTLIEISIVLVVIGLVIGGVLIGQDLIKAAEIRSQIAQTDEYNADVNTFRNLYNAIPGDIAEPNASAFGFVQRGQYAGEGDGSGILEGVGWHASGTNCGAFLSGETAMFWVDLSAAKLIKANFNTATPTGTPAFLVATAIPSYLPSAKIGGGNYVYAWGDNSCSSWPSEVFHRDQNYYQISLVTGTDAARHLQGEVGLTVMQAYAIDKKIDDGLPQSGKVFAQYWRFYSGVGKIFWAGTTNSSLAAYTTATPASATTCFDNANVAGAVQQYSIAQNGGNGINCALNIRFNN